MGAPLRKRVAQAEPDVPAFSLLGRGKPLLFQFLVQRAQPRAVVPENLVILREGGEKFQRVAVLILGRAIETDDDVVEVFHAFEFVDDLWQRVGLDFGVQRGENEPHRPCFCEAHELRFEFLDGAVAEVVQSGDRAVLVKISHVCWF